MTGEKKTILIAGYYGFHNLGDEMILTALMEGLNRIAPDHSVIVVSGDPADTHRRHGVEAVLWTDLRAIEQAVNRSCLVILGGGGLFHDQYSFQLDPAHLLTPNHAGLTYYTDICLFAHFLRVPYVLASVGVGPLQSRTAKELTTWCFQHASVATVRDQESLKELSQLDGLVGLEMGRVQISADLAILHPHWLDLLCAPGTRGDLKRLAVIPRSWVDERGGREWETELAGALSKVKVDEIVFLPFQTLVSGDDVDDEAVCRRIMAFPDLSRCHKRIEVLPLNVERLSEILSTCMGVVAMRYHGVLAGLQADKPTMALAYNPKVTSLMVDTGFGEWSLEPSRWLLPEIQGMLQSILSRDVSIPSRWREELRARSRITLDQIKLALASPPPTDPKDNFFVDALFDKRTKLEWRKREVESLTKELLQIQTSRYWRLMGWYWRLRHAVGGLWRKVRRVWLRGIGKPLSRIGPGWRGYSKFNIRPPTWEVWGLPSANPDKVDVFIFPIIDWDFRFQRPQQLARGLAAAGHRVFYLSPSFNPDGLLKQVIEPNIYQLKLPDSSNTSIYTDLPSEKAIGQQVRAIAMAAHAADVAEAVCLVQLPYWAPLAGELCRLNGWKLVYDCMDEHVGFSTNTPEMVAQEEELLQDADLVLATSGPLFERCQTISNNVKRLPNAADLGHFSTASQKISPPADFPTTDRPVIGYVGAISDWFDFELLRHAVENIPEAVFYLIGDTWGSDEHRDLASLPNVHFAGEKPYQSLPAYLAQFDVCLIPFKDTPLTRATDPVKVYEYLAAGKPVVARDLPELKKFGEVVRLADSLPAFTRAIRDALDANTIAQAEERKRQVTDHDWSERVDRLRHWVEELYTPVSLVIPVWNQLEQTRQCLTSLTETTHYPNLELIVVDNGSEADTASYLRDLAAEDARFKIIRSEDNIGFGPAVNRGLNQARGQILGILNNDVILTRGWLSRLLAHLKRDLTVGMIGPVTNAVGNEALLPFDYTDRGKLETFSSQVAFNFAGRSAPIPMLAMFCVLIPRQVFNQVGGLDERFSVGMFEDDDYAIRLRQMGFRPACARDVFIHHHGQASFDQLGAPRYRAVFQRNKAAFEAKWGVKWVGHTNRGLDEYEDAAQWMIESVPASRDAVVIFPKIEHEKERDWKELLEAPEFANRALAYWGKDGLVDFFSRDGKHCEVPWVGLDVVDGTLLVGFDDTPPSEIWTRLRGAQYKMQPNNDR